MHFTNAKKRQRHFSRFLFLFGLYLVGKNDALGGGLVGGNDRVVACNVLGVKCNTNTQNCIDNE